MPCLDCNNFCGRGARRCLPCYRIKMIERNHKDAPERMRINNPMKSLASREKMKKSLKRIGHKPIIQGGNGKPLSIPHKTLWQNLNCSWCSEFVVVTGTYRGSGVPFHYKIDLAYPELKLGVEIDGASHCLIARQKQDIKKEEYLKELGWRIIRFKNKEIINNLNECIKIINENVNSIKTISTKNI